jgi:hypothetical protein
MELQQGRAIASAETVRRHHARWFQTQLAAAERREGLDLAVVKLIGNE